MQLQYEVALFSCGMRDGPRRDVNHAAQLKRLLAYDAAWRQLDWTDARSLDHLSGAFHPTAVSGSTIAFIPFGPGPVSGFKLLIQQLPSTLRGTDERHWELQFQHMQVHDTLMDVSQDLLILLEPDSLCVYFRRLLSSFPRVPCVCKLTFSYDSPQIKLYDDIPCVQPEYGSSTSAGRERGSP